MTAKSMLDKIWERHVVIPESPQTPAIVYIDLHLVHEVTTPQAFSLLKERGITVRRPDRTLATLDHSIPTRPDLVARGYEGMQPAAGRQVRQMVENCEEFGITLRGPGNREQGIVHVIGPELGASQPGMTIVCGDSHTATHGALGALAFGIGTTEVGHVLATQCLLQRKPRSMAINIEGELGQGVTAKDLILAIINQIGVSGGTGHVIEYRGSTVSALSMDERMTICNMSIEAGARAGMMAPDDVTFAYLKGRPMAPAGADWDKAVQDWRSLASDPGANFDREIFLDAAQIEPMITFGTNPGAGIGIREDIPPPTDAASRKALEYMGLKPGRPLFGHLVDMVFVGSCTNSRLSDLEAAAAVLRGRKVKPGVRMLVVPGSHKIKTEAEKLGLDKIFTAAGAEWHEAGCSMCLGMNGDIAAPGQYVVSTSNRNFEGRQGPGARTMLASPATAAASAIAGAVADPRNFLNDGSV
jgi:3-isopropylmalate/(R)-2-methylmalate dehydratase large subunit